MTFIYDKIGKTYSIGRGEDTAIASQIHAQLSEAKSVLNLGAGTGSYEPRNIVTCALEPSFEMLAQRKRGSAPAIQAFAETLPFSNESFTHVMTVLSMHHWSDRNLAFTEIKRVVRSRFVAFTWDTASRPWWLTEEYFPELHELDCQKFPSRNEISQAFPGARFFPVLIPAACSDGFLAAYWAKPEAYLDTLARSCMSSFTKISGVEEGLLRLKKDLSSGRWFKKYGHLLSEPALDAGYTLVVWDKVKARA